MMVTHPTILATLVAQRQQELLLEAAEWRRAPRRHRKSRH
jgi:hypothetical protein